MADHDVGHLDDATWDRLAANELSALERDRYFDHVTSCADCSRVWRGLLTLKSEAEARGLIAASAIPSRPWWQAQMIPLAVAASVVLAVAGFFVTLRTDVDPAAIRGTAMPSVDGLVVEYPADNVPQFKWTAIPGATKYRLEIFTEDGSPLWTGDVTAPPVSWPPALPHANGRYRWRIEAAGADGTIARSRLTALEIAR